MPKTPTDIRSLARSYSPKALRVLRGISNQAKAPPAARVAASIAIIDRGWGKAAQPLIGGLDGDNPIAITRIERVIVKPKPTEDED